MSVELPPPLHYWSFDQPGGATGNVVTDSVGGLDALPALAASAWSAPGKFRGGMRLGAATTGLVRLRRADGTAPPDLPAPWTVSVWIKRHGGRGGALVTSDNYGVKIEQHSTAQLLGVTYYGQWDRSINRSLPANTWAHLTVVGTATETRFYVDGAPAGAVDAGLGLGRSLLGARQKVSGGQLITADVLEATIDELRIYDRALSPEQVASLATLDPGPLPFEKLPLEAVKEAIGAGAARLAQLIPYAWYFTYDTNTENTAIADGGADMFDEGNILMTDIDTLVYSDNTVRRHPAVGPRGSYFTLQLRQLFVCVAELDGANTLGTRGLVGREGGAADGMELTTMVGGARFRGFVKRSHGTDAPSVNHLFIVRDDASRGSHAFPNDAHLDDHTLSGLPAQGRVYYLMFGARQKRRGALVGREQFQAIMDAFLGILGDRARPPAP